MIQPAKFNRLDDNIFRRVEDGKPACLSCGKALRPRTRSVHGETVEEAKSKLPAGCKVSRVKKTLTWGADVSYIPNDLTWGEHSSEGYFCTQMCGVAFGILYAKKLGYKPAMGHPDTVIRRPS